MADLKMVDVAMLPPCYGHVHGENDEQMDGMGYQFNGLRGFFSQMTQLEAPKKKERAANCSKEPFALFQVQNKGVFRRSCASSLAKKPGKKGQQNFGIAEGLDPQVLLVDKMGRTKT